MQRVTVRRATVADIDGLVTSITGLFAEDSVRDKLRNPGWPQTHAADDEAENMANPDVLVLLAELDGSVIGHLTGGFYAASAMWTGPRAYLTANAGAIRFYQRHGFAPLETTLAIDI
jgi:hypothetical protein